MPNSCQSLSFAETAHRLHGLNVRGMRHRLCCVNEVPLPELAACRQEAYSITATAHINVETITEELQGKWPPVSFRFSRFDSYNVTQAVIIMCSDNPDRLCQPDSDVLLSLTIDRTMRSWMHSRYSLRLYYWCDKFWMALLDLQPGVSTILDVLSYEDLCTDRYGMVDVIYEVPFSDRFNIQGSLVTSGYKVSSPPRSDSNG